VHVRSVVVAAVVAVSIAGSSGAAADASDYGSVRDVRAVRTALQTYERNFCATMMPPPVSRCFANRDDMHGVTVIGAYAIGTRGVAPATYQELFHRAKRTWSLVRSSAAVGFAATELVQSGVPPTAARQLVAHDETALSASQPQAPERHCIHTAVRSVEPYFKDDPSSGAVVQVFGRIYDPYRGTLPPSVQERGHTALLQIRPGDRVQVCLVQAPTPDRSHPHGCDPARDERGRWYRLFDYRLRRAFADPNANHGCGGA
jgi:hypothetical protein